MAPFVLAVDGGNTKTVAVVAQLDGGIAGVGYSGCSDIYNATPIAGEGATTDAALRNALRAITSALASASAAPDDMLATVLNMAGADWPEDIAFWREAMVARGFQRVVAQNDALGVLFAATPDATGVSVVAGTGVATGARAASGAVWHSSFWQDEAQGGGRLGQNALYAIYRAELGLAPPTSLTARALAFLGVHTVEDALHLFHNRLAPPPIRVDRLAPLLLDEAHAGDAAALRIVREHGQALGDMALVAARKVGLSREGFHLALAGGLFHHPTSVLEDAIVAHVRAASPEVRATRSPVEPIVGVTLEALGMAGAPHGLALTRPLASAIHAASQPAHAADG